MPSQLASAVPREPSLKEIVDLEISPAFQSLLYDLNLRRIKSEYELMNATTVQDHGYDLIRKGEILSLSYAIEWIERIKIEKEKEMKNNER